MVVSLPKNEYDIEVVVYSNTTLTLRYYENVNYSIYFQINYLLIHT